jgi:hypothetical protein
MVKRLIKKLLVFTIPFVLITALFFCFEPYDYWSLKGDDWYQSRHIASMRELLVEKPGKIILGDSRMANLNADYIESVSGERYTNLAYGGATMNESIGQFWYAAEHTTLEKVVISVNFYTVNGNLFSDRLDAIIEKCENPLAFMSDFSVWSNTFDNTKYKALDLMADATGDDSLRVHLDDPSSLTQADPEPSATIVSGYREDIYDHAMIVRANSGVFTLSGQGNYLWRLEEIAAYCNANNIELIFVIEPCSGALWDFMIFQDELEVFVSRYKDRLKSVATVYDSEFYNDFARDDSNFLDSLHLAKDEKLRQARIIFGGEDSPYCLKTTPQQYLAGDYTLTDQMTMRPPADAAGPDAAGPDADWLDADWLGSNPPDAAEPETPVQP